MAAAAFAMQEAAARQNSNTVNLLLETANAYKSASNRAEIIIQAQSADIKELQSRLELARKQEAVKLAEIADLKAELKALKGTPRVQEVDDNV